MPQVGETRSGATETVRWDGSRWNPVASAAPAGHDAGFLSDLASGLREHPADTLKGFLQGAATGVPNAVKIAQVAAPIVTGGASIPVQAAVGAGSNIVGDLIDRAAGDPRAPQSFTDLMLHAGEGGLLQGGVAGAARGVNAIRGLGSATKQSLMGGALGAVDGYHRSGISGAITEGAIGAATGGTIGKYSGKIDALAKLLGLSPAAAEEAAVTAEQGGFAPGASRARSGGGVWDDLSAPIPEKPNYSNRPPAYEPQPVSPEAHATAQKVDTYMPNSSGPVQEGVPTGPMPIPAPEGRLVPGQTPSTEDQLSTMLEGMRTPSPKPPASLSALDMLDELAQGENPSPAVKAIRDRMTGQARFNEVLGANEPVTGNASELPASLAALPEDTGMQPFSDFSDSLDNVINADGPVEDFARSTKKDWTKKQYQQAGYAAMPDLDVTNPRVAR